MRGFGFQYDTATGLRYWYIGADGIKRWADNDQACNPGQFPAECVPNLYTSAATCAENEEK